MSFTGNAKLVGEQGREGGDQFPEMRLPVPLEEESVACPRGDFCMCSCSRSLSRPRNANKMLKICFHLCWLPTLPSRKAGKELIWFLAESHHT